MINSDEEFLSTLPALFPKIKSLTWTDRGNAIDEPIIPSYEGLINWSNLEDIYQFTTNLSLTTHLLKACICSRLKDIIITFSDNEVGDYDGEPMRELIENIHNAPLFEKISFGSTTIKMNDLESLHEKAPELKEVEFDNVQLDDENIGSIIIRPAKHVQSFILHLGSNDLASISIEHQHVFIKWLSYIGKKSQNVQQLDMYLDDDVDTVHQTSSILENPLITALSNIKNLNSYAVVVFPLAKRILDTFDMNNIKLKSLELKSLKGNEQVAQFFENIQSSKSTTALETLEVNFFDNVDITMFARTLADMKLDYLDHVIISGDKIDGFHVFKN